MVAASATPSLIGIPRSELEAAFAAAGDKPFRARQVMRWLYERGELDWNAMTDLSLALRQRLAADYSLALPAVSSRLDSADGTRKWALDVGRGQLIEMVFIPEDRRGTLCVSSQVGCAMDCPFC